MRTDRRAGAYEVPYPRRMSHTPLPRVADSPTELVSPAMAMADHDGAVSMDFGVQLQFGASRRASVLESSFPPVGRTVTSETQPEPRASVSMPDSDRSSDRSRQDLRSLQRLQKSKYTQRYLHSSVEREFLVFSHDGATLRCATCAFFTVNAVLLVCLQAFVLTSVPLAGALTGLMTAILALCVFTHPAVGQRLPCTFEFLRESKCTAFVVEYLAAAMTAVFASIIVLMEPPAVTNAEGIMTRPLVNFIGMLSWLFAPVPPRVITALPALCAYEAVAAFAFYTRAASGFEAQHACALSLVAMDLIGAVVLLVAWEGAPPRHK
jgi:hypothetical protein